ncbi:hypothetical protein L2E82_38988 [Cichorium intybus]|uniref:Uncharacterized protein n=1 Tax=Cichorium intybus TaxID=13427 RepID=A0ACB9AG80_CICIN|nr:hypothetical protein L2E82_38988 [Cichorium intybus]
MNLQSGDAGHDDDNQDASSECSEQVAKANGKAKKAAPAAAEQQRAQSAAAAPTKKAAAAPAKTAAKPAAKKKYTQQTPAKTIPNLCGAWAPTIYIKRQKGTAKRTKKTRAEHGYPLVMSQIGFV